MRHICASLLVWFITSGLCLAQDSRADVFGGYSYLNLSTNGLSSRQNANGWEASISGNFNKWFAAEADVSGYYKNYDVLGVNVAVRDYSYLAGPRINFKPIFAHALIGGDHLGAGALGLSASQDGLAGAFGGGVQWKYSRHLSFRASADYVLSRHNILGGSSVTQNNVRASVGIVYSFGTAKRVSGTTGQASSRAPTAGTQIPSFGIVVSLGHAQGAEIIDLARNGAAAMAGLNPGDVIDAVDGRPVNNPMELEAALSSEAVGNKVRIGFRVRGIWQAEAVLVLGGSR